MACGPKGVRVVRKDRASAVWRVWVLSCVCGAGILVGAVLGRGGWYYGGCDDVGVFACGCRKRGGEPVWLVPSPSLFCYVERMTGLEPAASTLGGWRSGLLSYIRSVRRLFERCQLACLCVAGFGADDGA